MTGAFTFVLYIPFPQSFPFPLPLPRPILLDPDIMRDRGNTFQLRRSARVLSHRSWNPFRREPASRAAPSREIAYRDAPEEGEGVQHGDTRLAEDIESVTPKPKEPFTVVNQIQRTILNSWLNLLLLAVPVGIALNCVDSVNRVAVFVVNFIAIIPLAAMLSFATEEIALRTGETLGGLLNATFGYVMPRARCKAKSHVLTCMDTEMPSS